MESRAVVMDEAKADEMRAKGHKVPKMERIKKKSKLSAEDRVWCVNRLWVLRQVLLSQTPSLDKTDLKRMMRVDARVDKTGRMAHFIEESYMNYETSRAEGEFAQFFDLLCDDGTTRHVVDNIITALKISDLERLGEMPRGSSLKYIQDIAVKEAKRDATEEELEDRKVRAPAGPYGYAQVQEMKRREAARERRDETQKVW